MTNANDLIPLINIEIKRVNESIKDIEKFTTQDPIISAKNDVKRAKLTRQSIKNEINSLLDLDKSVSRFIFDPIESIKDSFNLGIDYLCSAYSNIILACYCPKYNFKNDEDVLTALRLENRINDYNNEISRLKTLKL